MALWSCSFEIIFGVEQDNEKRNYRIIDQCHHFNYGRSGFSQFLFSISLLNITVSLVDLYLSVRKKEPFCWMTVFSSWITPQRIPTVNSDGCVFYLVCGSVHAISMPGSCHKRQNPQALTPQAPIRNRQTRKDANTKGLNRNTNLT